MSLNQDCTVHTIFILVFLALGIYNFNFVTHVVFSKFPIVNKLKEYLFSWKLVTNYSYELFLVDSGTIIRELIKDQMFDPKADMCFSWLLFPLAAARQQISMKFDPIPHWDFLPKFLSLHYYTTLEGVLGVHRSGQAEGTIIYLFSPLFFSQNGVTLKKATNIIKIL